MAPTELLAEQHFGRIVQWLAPLGVRVTWLAGRLTAASKRKAQAAAAEGEAQLVIGTHALIQDAVSFDRLGLGDRRRATSLRRGATAGTAWFGRHDGAAHADAVGDADPAHAGNELSRGPRCLGH